MAWENVVVKDFDSNISDDQLQRWKGNESHSNNKKSIAFYYAGWLAVCAAGTVSGVRARRFTAAVRPLMTWLTSLHNAQDRCAVNWFTCSLIRKLHLQAIDYLWLQCQVVKNLKTFVCRLIDFLFVTSREGETSNFIYRSLIRIQNSLTLLNKLTNNIVTALFSL